MNKIIFFLLGILLINVVAATDVAYVVATGANQKFVDEINNAGLTYTVIASSQVKTTDFSKYKMMLIGNDYFSNWNEIPVSQIPTLIVNGRNIVEWGWAKRITTASQSTPIKINLSGCKNSAICKDLTGEVQIYNSATPSIYYLDRLDVYNGLKPIATNTYDDKDLVIAFADAGTTLTFSGKPDTFVKADSIFFGMTEISYWTENTKQLFRNSLLALGGGSSLNLNLKKGTNLISFPLTLQSNDIDDFLTKHQEITSIKEYNGNIVNASQIFNHKGYFLGATSDIILTIKGILPKQTQTMNLNSGMNLVGITSQVNINLDTLPSGIIEVAKRNLDGSYEIATKYSDGWFNSFALEPGRGYWFKTNQSVKWSYAPI